MRGHSPNGGNLSQHPNRPNTSLAACCPLSNSLPRERGRGGVRVKSSARKTGCVGCFLLFRRPASTVVNPSCFSNCLKPQNPLQPAPSPWGRVGERVFSQIAAIFPNTLTTQIQALRLVALSLTLSHGREDGVAVGIKGSARKQVVQATFCFSDDLQSTAVNPSCLSNYLKPQNPLQSAPSPVGEGRGEGILPNRDNLSQFPNRPPNTSLAACYPLSNSLPRGERTGWLLGLRGSARKQVEQATFCFSDDLQSTAVNPSCFSNRLQP